MKKLVLLSALAAGIMTAGAANISDLYTVTYEGTPVANGATIEADHWDGNMGLYPCDIDFKLKSAATNVKFNVLGEYTGLPSYDQQVADVKAWGEPSICWAAGSAGNCEPNTGTPPTISNFTLTNTTDIQIQFHVLSKVSSEIGPDFNPNDPSTWPQPIAPSETSLYKLSFTGSVDGVTANDPFVIYVAIGPNASGVDEVAVDDSNAPVEYYDLTGRKVMNPAKGQIVIERKGAKSVKKIMK